MIMKTHNILSYWLFTALMCLILGACSEEEDYSTVVEIESGNLKAVTYDSAKFSGKVVSGNAKEIGVCWGLNPNPTVNDTSVSMGRENRVFDYTITGLQEGTQYYVRAWARTSDDSIVYGEEKTCVTMAHGRPVVYITNILNISETTATIVSKMLVDGGLEISEFGIVYGTEEGVDTQNGQKVVLNVTTIDLKTLVEGLVDNQTYYVKSYAIAKGETYYSKEVSFVTEMYAAPVLEVETENVTGDSFDAKVKVTSGTPLPVLEYGLVYATTTEPTVENATKVVFGEGDGEKTLAIEGLTDDTAYYIRPYAINKNGISYGEEVVVLTLSKKAMVSTVATSFVTAHRAKVAGEILSLGLLNAPITEVGICWSTNPSPTVDDSTIQSTATEVGEFDALQLFCLNPSTTYYARAYITNEYGTNYGEEITFTTREAVGNYFTNPTNPTGNYFNGLNMTDTYPGPDDAYSPYQVQAYETAKQVVGLYNRNFTAYRFYLMPDADGKPAYFETRIAYSNSSGTNYQAIWRTKLDISDKFVYTCSHLHAHTNTGNFINTANKNGLTEEFEKATNFIVNDSFVIDWEDETSSTVSTTDRNAVFYVIPVNSPENYMRMGVFRVTGLKAYADAPWW